MCGVSRDSSRPRGGGRNSWVVVLGSRFTMPNSDTPVWILFFGTHFRGIILQPLGLIADSDFILTALFHGYFHFAHDLLYQTYSTLNVGRNGRAMESPQNRPRGRPPLYGPGPAPRMFGVHINMSQDIWDAVRKHAAAIGEPSLSHVARKLLRERLVELGYLKGPSNSYFSDRA